MVAVLVTDLVSFSEQVGRDRLDQALLQERWVCSGWVVWPSIALALPLSPPPSGDPAGPAPAAQHRGPVPAADVRSTAAAPHAADGRLAAAAPQQRPAPEPGGCAAGKD